MTHPKKTLDKKNVEGILEEIGTLLELKGENPFKTRAYFNAARVIAGLEGDLAEVVKAGRLRDIKGIGEALEEKITTLVMTGRLPYYEELRKSLPSGLLEMLKIPGLGPKKVKVLHENLKIHSIKELEKACRHDRLLDLEGFGQKTQENILKGLMQLQKHHGQFLLHQAWPEAEALEKYLRQSPKIIRLEIAGSLRRRKEVVKDIDFVASVTNPLTVGEYFIKFPDVERMIAKGDTKVSVELKHGIQADLRMVTDIEFPYALHHFTGSKEHNTAMRGRAQEKFHIKMNEYGLFKMKKNVEKLIPCHDERDIFKTLGLAYIPPELREDMGEIEVAENGTIPDLVEEKDLKGTFHCHTTSSDGKASVLEMAQAAQAMGLSYLGIADHSQVAVYAGGLTIEKIKRQREEIEKTNQKLIGFTVLQGLEIDILKDGTLDMTEKTLELLDFTVISVHSRFNLSREEMTKRLIKAMTNPYASILGHASGRLLISREPYEVDMEAVLETAAKRKLVVEINCNPRRLDLDWRWCLKAKKMGVKFSINPDAHETAGFKDLRFGVGIARKGWLTKQDVINTLPLADALSFL